MRGIGLALDAMELGTFRWDRPSGAYQCSARCKQIWGFSAHEDVTAEMMWGRVHPDDRHVASVAWEALKPGGPERYWIEHRIVLPDGTVRWVRVAGRAGQPGGGYGAMRDITACKVAERQLYERTSQLRAFVENAPVPIAIFDREMRYLAVSHQYAEDRRLDAAGLIGRSLYDVFPHLPGRWREIHQRALAGATQGSDSQLWVQPDGSPVWRRWELRPWYRAPDEVGGLILFAEDITERVQAQQELHRSRARLELAIHAGALGVYDWDLTTGRVEWDARMRELFGVGSDETLTGERLLECIHPEDRERVSAAVQEVVERGSEGMLDLEYRVAGRGDGPIRWLAASGRVLFEEDQVRIIGFAQDITDRKRAELALAESTEALRRDDERKNAYLAALSHELRNPLAPIRTAAQLLASPKLTCEQLSWISQMIRRQSGHMSLLLEDLLDVTRMCRGKLVLHKEHTPVLSIANSAIESARPLIEAKHHTLRVALPPDSLSAYADPHRLSQVIAKLLANAAKYTDPHGLIELLIAQEGSELVIQVRDNGVGMPSEAIDKIFTMFWQGDSRRNHTHGGLGIGLAFAEGVVQLHGGSIEARSEGPGRGSELTVRLPVIESATPTADSQPR